ncbi:Ankyrin repeat-containing domain,Ankyrin repeat, partial [Cinara cedri]
DGKIPLHYAAEMGYLDIVNALLERGADVNAIDNIKEIPLHYATRKGHVDIVNVLSKSGTNPSLRGRTLEGLAEKDNVKNLVKKSEIRLLNPTMACVGVICLTAACEVGVVAFFIVKGNIAVAPIPLILTAVVIAAIALVAGCIVHKALKPNDK